jgi:vitamin B12 transporter
MSSAKADETKRDTTVYSSPEIKVMADKVLVERDITGSAYSRISKADIELINPRQITEVLSGETGLFIKDYGGLGGLKTISMRGTSSQQTLVMIEGMKINSAQNNIFDFSLLPTGIVQSVDIIRGGASGLFGGNSIGGAVNFNIDCDPHQTTKGRVSYGSFDEFTFSASEAIHFTNSSLALDYEHINGSGNYGFDVNQYGSSKNYTRSNGDMNNDNLILRFNTESSDLEFKAIAIYGKSDRGLPGGVVQGYIADSRARLFNNSLNVILKSNLNISDKSILSFGLLTALSQEQYNDPASVFALKGDTTMNYDNRSFQFNTGYINENTNWHWGMNLEAGYTDMLGDMLQPDIGRFVKRSNLGLAGRLGLDLLNSSLFDFKCLAVIRLDAYSGLHPNYSPMLNLMIGLHDISLQLKAQVSGNFRVPSFNEMYYLNYGTANLRPEKSISYNLTAEYQLSEKMRFTLSGYSISTKDMIVSVPTSPVLMSARNMAEVLSRGIEFGSGINLFNDFLSLRYNYTLQYASDNQSGSPTYGKQLPYVPKEMLSMTAVVKLYDFILRINPSYTGFTFALPDEAYNSMIHSYWITNVTLSRKFQISSIACTLRLDAVNLFDERFSVIMNYPMPGRQLRATLGVNL